ncbi:MAG: TnsA endonuclease N-terminal domain-containing protein [Promethearchaeota archaeon]
MEKKNEVLVKKIIKFNGKTIKYYRPSQVRNVPLKYRSVRGFIPSLKYFRYPFLKHLKNLILNYESQFERNYLYLLDHDPNCIDLQTQPCCIDYITITEKKATLYPDIWAIFSDSKQFLFEVKPEKKLKKLIKDKNWAKRIEAITEFCKNRGWTYQIITENKINCVRLNNIKDLLVSAKHFSLSKINLDISNFNQILNEILKNSSIYFPQLVNLLSVRIHLAKSEIISLLKNQIYFGHLGIKWNIPLYNTEVFLNEEIPEPVYKLKENLNHAESSEFDENNEHKILPLNFQKKYKERLDLIIPIIDKYGSEAKKRHVLQFCQENDQAFKKTYNWYLIWKKNGKNGLKPKKIIHKKNHLKNSQASELLDSFIQKWNKDDWTSYTEAYENEFVPLCLKNNIPEIEIPTKQTMINWIKKKLPYTEQLGKQRSKSQKNIKRGLGDTYKEGRYPCSIIQMDHTLLDIWLVDSFTKQPLGRPWLTMGIDVFSRSIWGYYISFEEPSRESVLKAILIGFMQKKDLQEWKNFEAQSLKDGFDPKSYYIPSGGFPSVIQVDNGLDFRANLVKDFFMENNITIEFRPAKVPEFGGFIESSWDTINDGIRGAKLKGRVFSLPKSRESVKRPKFKCPVGYNAKEHATYTLDWFKEWFFGYITTKYSPDTKARQEHSPNEVWNDGLSGNSYQPMGGAVRFSTLNEYYFLEFLSKNQCKSRLNEKGLRNKNVLYSSKWLRDARKKGILKDKITYKFRVDRLDVRFAFIIDPVTSDIRRLDAYKYDGDDRITKFLIRGLGKEVGYKEFQISEKMLENIKKNIGSTNYNKVERFGMMDMINKKLKEKGKISKKEQKFLEITSKTPEGRRTMAEAVKSIQKNKIEQENTAIIKEENSIKMDNLIEEEDLEDYLTEMDDLTDFINNVKDGRL